MTQFTRMYILLSLLKPLFKMNNRLSIKKIRTKNLSKDDIIKWYRLCSEELKYNWHFFNKLIKLSQLVYFGFNSNNELKAACAITYKFFSEKKKKNILIKTNLVCVSKGYRGGPFIRHVGWRAMLNSIRFGLYAPRYWVSVMLTPTAYILMGKTFSTFFPSPYCQNTPMIETITHYLSHGYFEERYQVGTFNGSGLQSANKIKLYPDASPYTHQLHNFYLEKTPNYTNGQALVCIVPLHAKNLISLLLKNKKQLLAKPLLPKGMQK